MKIKIDLESEEVEDIIKEHVLKKFPVDTAGQEVHVEGAYGSFSVEISEKKGPTEEVIDEIDETEKS